jgi:hypothetical protein
MQSGEHLSARDGAEEEFDPARQARFALESERLHEGLASESLLTALLDPGTDVRDVMALPLSEPDRKLLAAILLKDDEELTPERVDGAIRALRRIHLRRKLEQVQRELQGPAARETAHMQELLLEKVRIKRALMDPGLGGETGTTGIG